MSGIVLLSVLRNLPAGATGGVVFTSVLKNVAPEGD